MNIERTKHIVIVTVLFIICAVGILMVAAYFQMPRQEFDPLAITEGPIRVTLEPRMRTAISDLETNTAATNTAKILTPTLARTENDAHE